MPSIQIVTELCSLARSVETQNARISCAVPAWSRWARNNLPQLWNDSGHCALAFCMRVHVLVLDHAAKKNGGEMTFEEWDWNAMAALFNGAACNCVCGTLLVLAAAEYVGLFPEKVHAMAGPAHLWVRAERTCKPPSGRPEWWFLETTMRPDTRLSIDRQLERADARTDTQQSSWVKAQRDTGGSGPYAPWFSYTSPRLLVQEAFINQYLKDNGAASRERIFALLDTEPRHTLASNAWILDVRKLRVLQLTRRDGGGKTQEQFELVASMLKTIRESEWPNESFLKSIYFIVKWLTWTPTYNRDDENSTRITANSTKLKRRVEEMISDIAPEARRTHSDAMNRLWNGVDVYMSMWTMD